MLVTIPEILSHYMLTDHQVDLIIESLVEKGAEELADEDHETCQLIAIIKAQRTSQNGADVVSCACASCHRTIQIPNDLLCNKWRDTSWEFFCPFCDPYCNEPRCVLCRTAHNGHHLVEATNAPAG